MNGVAPALRLVAELRSGACLVARPRSAVAHLYRGPLTASQRVPSNRRVVCGIRARALSMVEQLRPRRWCRRCNLLTPPTDEQLRTRADWLTLFGHLATADLRTAAAWSRTVAETHQVGLVARMLCGSKPLGKRDRLTIEQRARLDLFEDIATRRRFLANQERTDEERAAIALRHEAEEHDRKRIAKARRDEAATNRAVDLDGGGHYLTPPERAALRPDISHRSPRSTRP